MGTGMGTGMGTFPTPSEDVLGDMRAFDAFVTQYQEYKSKAQDQRRTPVSLAH